MDVSTVRYLIRFGAETLRAPTLQYGDSKRETPLLASWSFANDRFAIAKGIDRLNVLALERTLSRDGLPSFAANMVARLQHHGVSVANADPYYDFPQYESLHTELEDWFPAAAKNDCNIVVLEEKNEDKYAQIKRSGDLFHGKHTLCVTSKKLMKYRGNQDNGYLQYMSNLALKVNMKAQGDNHRFEIVSAPAFQRDRTIVLGAVSPLSLTIIDFR